MVVYPYANTISDYPKINNDKMKSKKVNSILIKLDEIESELHRMKLVNSPENLTKEDKYELEIASNWLSKVGIRLSQINHAD